MSEFRLDKLAEQIREEISQLIFSGKIKDPRVSNFLSINRVEVSGVMDAHKTKQGVRGLENAAGFIRTSLAKKLHIHQCPQFTFIYDESIEDGFNMVKKLEALEASSNSGNNAQE